jgi:hypothetical protein
MEEMNERKQVFGSKLLTFTESATV